MPRDPSFSILYADLKAGKTADALATFPAGVYVAAPGALAPAEALWGFEAPKRYDLETFEDVSKFAASLTPAHAALIMDDATLIADRTAGFLARKGLGGWDLWAVVLRQAVHLRDLLRRKGIHIVMTCHPRAAHIENGVRLRGGPSFQGQCATKIPAASDFLLRAEARPGAAGAAAGADLGLGEGQTQSAAPRAIGWPMVYRTAFHPDWLQGSRYDTPDLSPMNLREILELAGFKVPRLAGLEWQDAVADQFARKLVEVGLGNATKVAEALARVRDACLSRLTKNEPHVYWAIRDGYDRAVLWTAKAAQRRAMWGV